VTEPRPSWRSDAGGDGVTLRLLWPQWQGAGTVSVQELAPEFPFDVARRGYAVGSAVLAAVLPANDGPTAAVPVAMDDTGLELREGIEAKEAILTQWGIRSFSPDDLREATQPLLDWLAGTGCSRLAIHFDVDTIDSDEIVLGLGAEQGGLTSAQVRHIVDDINASADVVGMTVAEFIPRQVMHLQHLLTGFPLLRASTYT
jgi:Arginase family